MSFCKDCIQGVRHEGEPSGTLETIDGVACYVATPTVDYAKDKVILLLPDAFGIELINAQLLADDFAKNGFKVVAIDYLNGDCVPADKSQTLNVKSFDFYGWLAAIAPRSLALHSTRSSLRSKRKALPSLEPRVTASAVVTTFDLAFDNVIQCAVVSHPSLLNIPADLETYFSKSAAPLLINSCENDIMFSAEVQAKADEIFGDGKFAPGYRREYFPGCTHGFAVRGDLSDPLVKAGKEGSFLASVEFFLAHL
ncbi:hypothetical protein DFJ58DRAFT_274037 [Suillus subalutaceus]|uniref:uncharacterized protein n=1 Tax=Suillus subalutaceus TaxID=48586 RepID=UPI001B86232F|nr:uncharacterized protein DFJ58DRAFT_274037 [Suillus subalutaceus]KAG1860245.1 hypothetical protein DFJ58DRAFT_274037 [Suillus subalutaceus]